MVNNPTAFDPEDEDNHERILERYRYVIQSMLEMDYITDAEAAKYRQNLPSFPTAPPVTASVVPRAFCSRWSSAS